MVARTYSATINTVEEAYNNHEACAEMIPKTPLARVEHRVEQYYRGLCESTDQRGLHLNRLPRVFAADRPSDSPLHSAFSLR